MSQNARKNIARKKKINRKSYRQLSISYANFEPKEGETPSETATRRKRIKNQLGNLKVAAGLS